MTTNLYTWTRGLAAASIACLSASPASAAVTTVFSDGFNASDSAFTGANSFNLNLDIAARQTGVLAPVSWVSNTSDVANDFQHQLFPTTTSPGQPLQLAEAGTNPAPSPIFGYRTMVSPNYNFKGTIAGGAVVGRRVTFDMDCGVIVQGNPNWFTQTGFVIGGGATLLDSEAQRESAAGLPLSPSFSIQMVEDRFAGNGNFLQFWDSIDIVGNLVPNPAGAGVASFQIDVADPTDGNPWDGVGQTDIAVSVNGTSVFNFSKPDGGYADNFMTFYQQRNLAGNSLATATVENFIVYAVSDPAPLAGDYNQDGSVNAADYTRWRDAEGQAVTLPNANPSATTPALVDAEDYDYWVTNYGSMTPATATAVPEPAAIVCLAMALAASGAARRARVRR
ncbi:MAG: hypothetical protein ACRCT8_01845 [Lacipirellulaceae bacterium]